MASVRAPEHRGSAVALSSGGKDSILALHMAQDYGMEVRLIATALPEDPESMLFHTHNVALVKSVGECMGIEWRGVRVRAEREEDDLKDSLKGVDASFLITGGIASNYQRQRFDRVATELGLRHFAPLWGTSPELLYQSILNRRMDVLIVAVAAYGLTEDWLGVHLDAERVQRLLNLSERYRFNPTGEGGDLDSFVLDAPLYRKRIEVCAAKKHWSLDHGHLEIDGIELVEKQVG